MTLSNFLSKDDLIDLTGFQQKKSQISELRRRGIVHQIRADGFPLVLNNHIQKLFDGAVESSTKIQKSQTPNWGALGG